MACLNVTLRQKLDQMKVLKGFVIKNHLTISVSNGGVLGADRICYKGLMMSACVVDVDSEDVKQSLCEELDQSRIE